MNQALKFTLVASCCVIGISGCGAPVLSSMSPQVWKPASEVLLVDNPSGWKAADVQQAGLDASVVVNVDAVAGSDLISQLNTSLANSPVGLYVIVLNSIPSNQLWSVIQQHPNVRFEVIGSTATPPTLQNLRVVQADPETEAYLLGWGLGQLSGLQSQTQIGWDLDTTPSLSKSEIEAILAGIYVANPTVSIVPFHLSQVQNSLGYGFLIPHLVFAPGALSAATEILLGANGVSLVSMASSAKAVLEPQPVPPETVLPADFQAFHGRNWKSGLTEVSTPDLKWQNGQVPPSLPGLINGMAPMVTPTMVSAAWKQVPGPLQVLWAPIVNLGS